MRPLSGTATHADLHDLYGAMDTRRRPDGPLPPPPRFELAAAPTARRHRRRTPDPAGGVVSPSPPAVHPASHERKAA
jgi:hypothetical protein